MTDPERMTLEMVVGPDTLGVVWEKYGVGRMFEEQESRSGGHWTAEFLKEHIASEKMQLWLCLEDRKFIKAALVTDINPYPNGLKTCMVVIIVGREPKSWIPLRHVLEDWAKRSGCEKIEAIGRLAWKSVIPDWKPSAIFFEKALT